MTPGSVIAPSARSSPNARSSGAASPATSSSVPPATMSVTISAESTWPPLSRSFFSAFISSSRRSSSPSPTVSIWAMRSVWPPAISYSLPSRARISDAVSDSTSLDSSNIARPKSPASRASTRSR